MILKPDFHMIRCAVFDFDGVILDSSGLKTEAFKKLYRQYDAICDEAMKFHYEQKGMSRFKQFHYVANTIMKTSDPERIIKEMSERFASIVFHMIAEAPFVIGARELIEFLAPLIPLFVLSSSPADELERIITARGLKSYFRSYHGGVDFKGDLILKIMAEVGIEPREVLYVGDTLRDLAAAKASGVCFCGVKNSLVNFEGQNCFVVPELLTLKAAFQDAMKKPDEPV
jgi:phosphoglycolate phosphatase